jgi:hypothetical protein
MNSEGVSAAKAYVDVVERHKQFVQKCDSIAEKFKQEEKTSKTILSDYVTMVPAAKLKDGRYVRSVTKTSPLSITEQRIQEAYLSVTADDVKDSGSVANAVVDTLNRLCENVTTTVKITKDTKGLPPTAFPIPIAPENIQEECDNMDHAAKNLKVIRKHKRQSKKATEKLKDDLIETKITPNYKETLERVVHKRPYEEVDDNNFVNEEVHHHQPAIDDDDVSWGNEAPPSPSSEKEEDLPIVKETAVEESEIEEVVVAPKYPTIHIKKPPSVVFPGEEDKTLLPERPVSTQSGIVTVEKDSVVVESDVLEEDDIQMTMVENVKRGRKPTLKEFSEILRDVLQHTRTYKLFDKNREDLMLKSIQEFKLFIENGTTVGEKMKIVRTKPT